MLTWLPHIFKNSRRVRGVSTCILKFSLTLSLSCIPVLYPHFTRGCPFTPTRIPLSYTCLVISSSSILSTWLNHFKVLCFTTTNHSFFLTRHTKHSMHTFITLTFYCTDHTHHLWKPLSWLLVSYFPIPMHFLCTSVNFQLFTPTVLPQELWYSHCASRWQW